MIKTMTKPSKLIIATLTLATFGFNGCAKESELDTIKDAQMCLNKAAPSAAQACVSKLGSTDQANQLKCAAYFIQEGFGSPTKLIEAIENADSGGSTSSVNMISELSFSTQGQSTLAFNVCNNSGIPVYSQLSSLVQISTLAKGIDPTAVTPAEFEAAIATIPDATLGDLVTTTYNSSCTGNSSSGDALKEYCDQLSGALAEATPDDIGACVKYKLTGNNYPGLPCPAN